MVFSDTVMQHRALCLPKLVAGALCQNRRKSQHTCKLLTLTNVACLNQLSLLSFPDRQIEYTGLRKRGAITCVWRPVTLRDPIWQVTLYSSEACT